MSLCAWPGSQTNVRKLHVQQNMPLAQTRDDIVHGSYPVYIRIFTGCPRVEMFFFPFQFITNCKCTLLSLDFHRFVKYMQQIPIKRHYWDATKYQYSQIFYISSIKKLFGDIFMVS